jgi:hypothetical protein
MMRAFALLSLLGVALGQRSGDRSLAVHVNTGVETNWHGEKDVCSSWGEAFWYQFDGDAAVGKTFVSLYDEWGNPLNDHTLMTGIGEERFEETWHVLAFEPTESHTFAYFTTYGTAKSGTARTQKLFESPTFEYRGHNTEFIGPLRPRDDTSNQGTSSRNPTVSDFWSGYITRAHCGNTGWNDNCEIDFKSVVDVKCRNCPIGYSASPCSPSDRRSTACTACTTTTTQEGWFCTGAMPVYSVSYTKPPDFVKAQLECTDVSAFFTDCTYTSAERRKPHEPCPAGFFCSGGQLSRCRPGKYCPAQSSRENDCPGGHFCATPDRREPCPSGSKCPAGSTQPQGCKSGTYAFGSQETCSPCEPGTLAASDNAPSCQNCPQGTWQPLKGSVACSAIPAGHYSGDRKTLTACPAGSFCPAGSVNPTPCKSGTFSSGERAEICSECPAGSFCPAGSVKPTPCKPGTFSSDRAEVCSECPAGSSQSLSGKTMCEPCAVGSSQRFSGKVMCEPCAAGSSQNAPGKSSCNICRAGFVTANTTGLAECVACASNGTAMVDLVRSVCVCKQGFKGETCSAKISDGSAEATSRPTASAPSPPTGPSAGSDRDIALPAALGGLAGAALLVVGAVAWRRRQHRAGKPSLDSLDAWAGRPHTAI